MFSIILVLSLTSSLHGQGAMLAIPKGCKENYFITSDGIRLHYLTAGKGEAIIFIPGWTMPAEIFEKQIEHFSKTNLVIALDPRSQGKSAQATEGLSIDREAKDVKELVDHMRLSSYYLVGWSLGGPVLYTYLNLFNDPSIKGIIVVDAPLKIDAAFMSRITLRIKGLLLNKPETIDKFVRGMYKQAHSETYFDKVKKASLITPTNSAIALLSNFFFYNDSAWIQTLKTTDKPVLFIGAEGKEEVFKTINEEVKINYVVIPGSGHAVFVDKPVEFNQLIENFISKK